MKTHEDYRILNSRRPDSLEAIVDTYLENGYQLIGGLSVIVDGGGTWSYHQAVAKPYTPPYESTGPR